MAPSTPPNASNPEESPTAPVVAASVPPTPAPTVAISAPPASTGPSVTPAASTIPGPAFLQSTLPDSLCPEFSNLGDHRYYYQIRRPTIGFPDVSSQQEQAVLFSLSMFQALQHDLSILLKWNMYVACVACRIAVLGYMEDLWSSYIFADFLYLNQ
ncbi:hypothetical protein FPQ18DRAFT_384957 [Pyronema domesticum]|nr:hypothetical protein FPQ18DRAFT_384957 [Pyronema domesticum]